MDFRRRLFLSLLIFSSLSFQYLTPAAASGQSNSKVSLALFYETLCPYCSNFIVNYLAKIFRNGLIDIVHLQLVPYGNAVLAANSSIVCQHGPDECFLNTVEACAIDVWPDLTTHFSFIDCIESLVVERKHSKWASCFQKTGLDSQPIVDCYNSGFGKKLELQYAAQTDALQPPQRYVPWVLVNGQPLYEDYENFERYICKAYKGKLPEACSELSLATLQEEKTELPEGVCYGRRIHPFKRHTGIKRSAQKPHFTAG